MQIVYSQKRCRAPSTCRPNRTSATAIGGQLRFLYPQSGHDGVPNTTNSADVVQCIGSGDKKRRKLASEFCEQEGRLQVRRQWHGLSPKVAWTYHKNCKKNLKHDWMTSMNNENAQMEAEQQQRRRKSQYSHGRNLVVVWNNVSPNRCRILGSKRLVV